MAIRIKIPKSWNELTDKQMLKMAALVYSGKSGIVFDLLCIRILMDIRWYQLRKGIRLAYILSQIPLSELKQHFSYIYKLNDRTKFPAIINGFHAPLDKITNLSADEFAIADDLHIKWRETKNKEFLYYLLATLYSPTKQPRAAFDKNALPDKVAHFQKVPIQQMLAVELAYFGSKNYLQTRFPKAFPKSNKKQVAKNKKYGFSKVILQMAGGKFGNHEQTKSTNIYTFLEEFTQNLNDGPKNS